ncbi:Urease [Vibrio chagasii]|uniref:amidohydrolase n=1 Tax=Vibrio TaxID=662 RepID=UPI000CF448F1|nr:MULTISPECIES: amidohydrolase [Vibrio]MCG9561861.1 amidohydrolase [Vibrio chagasii]NOI94523.1 amidohydrolase [Vibrio sp. T3Y01]PQJ48397.1 urease [Vibrio splendidus]CAH7013210.1 Urease [Vibrio chagasii]CAH7119325.1 Urease [Vibrio chagasii]
MSNKLTLPRTALAALVTMLGAVSPALAQAESAVQSQAADQIFTNADIYGHRESDSIVTHDGKIIFIGDLEQTKTFQGQNTDVIDLGNAFVLPGFIDNHNHVFEAASELGGACELDSEATLEEQIPYLEACKINADSNGRGWLMGYGFSLESTLNSDSEYTPLEIIDSVFPNRPVVIMEQTSHSMWVNSKALKIARISPQSPAPQGGAYLKDPASGKLNGILLDNAGDQIMEMAWNSQSELFEQSYQGLMYGLEEAAAHGITTIGDGRMYWKRGWYDVWLEAEQNQDLTARVSLRPWVYPSMAMPSQLEVFEKMYSDNKSRLLLVDQVKMYSDGIFINGTAKTLAPYLDTYLPNSPNGLNYIPPAQMKQWLTALEKIGFSAHIHAIGDGAVRESLDAIESVRKQGSQKPYTLTHVELINDVDVPRFKQLGVTADFQVGSDYVAQHDHEWANAFLGARRAKAMMNLDAILKTDANITLSSDWNVHDINPLVGIANSLIMGKTGLTDIYTAIDAYTLNAAKSLGIDDITGTIEVGKSADFAILDKDITTLSARGIAKTQVLMTVLRGDVVYDASH